MESGFINQFGGMSGIGESVQKPYHMNFMQEMTTYQTKEVKTKTKDGREITSLETVTKGFDPMQFYTRLFPGLKNPQIMQQFSFSMMQN